MFEESGPWGTAMTDETNLETMSRQLAALTSRVAEMWRDMMQLRKDVSELRQDMSQMRKDMALANPVLDEHDRKFADIYRTLGIVPRTASDITGSRGVREESWPRRPTPTSGWCSNTRHRRRACGESLT
jgi:septal ring factor EnvC (AmiA/AmiB activator)